jgi:peptidyl-prolyl cis-trans isomerase A (cyclophilin A)
VGPAFSGIESLNGGESSAMCVSGRAGMTTPRVLIHTPVGSLTVEVDLQRAPLTAAHFLEFAQRGYLSHSSIYRITTFANCVKQPSIEVVQFGLSGKSVKDFPLPPVPHEPTGTTGLSHVDGAISLARLQPGTGTCAFFISIGNQPQLDEGGERAADRLGFAVFGRVVERRETLAAIHRLAGDKEMLEAPIPISGEVAGPRSETTPTG